MSNSARKTGDKMENILGLKIKHPKRIPKKVENIKEESLAHIKQTEDSHSMVQSWNDDTFMFALNLCADPIALKKLIMKRVLKNEDRFNFYWILEDKNERF